MPILEEVQLDTRSGPLAGLRAPGSPGPEGAGGPPVLFLHGFLDNAASFVPLCRHLDGIDAVALDFPGHGHSGHRHPSARYYLVDYLYDVDAALDALGWESCHLVGHSLGAAVSSLYAAAAPERVRSVVMIDALGPMSESPDTGASRLQRSLRSVREGPRRRKAYASVEEMIGARIKVNSDLSPESARLICERSIRQAGDHFEWTNDPALYWVSPVLLTELQIHEYLQHIKAGVLTLTATPYAPYVNEEKVKSRTTAIPHGRHLTVEGHHHFHMDQPETIARLVKEFILEQDEPFADSPGNRP